MWVSGPSQTGLGLIRGHKEGSTATKRSRERDLDPGTSDTPFFFLFLFFFCSFYMLFFVHETSAMFFGCFSGSPRFQPISCYSLQVR